MERKTIIALGVLAAMILFFWYASAVSIICMALGIVLGMGIMGYLILTENPMLLFIISQQQKKSMERVNHEISK